MIRRLAFLLVLIAVPVHGQIATYKACSPRATPPMTCDSAAKGLCYTDTDDNKAYRCDGTSWTREWSDPAATVSSLAGTANQIAASASTGAITLSIPSNPTLPGTTTGTFSGNITGAVTGNASTATALAANGANCSAGSYPLGVDASGAVESCTSASGGAGDVVGPSSSVDNALARYDGTTGKLLQGYTSGAPTISDTGGMVIGGGTGEVGITISTTSGTHPALRINVAAGDLEGAPISFRDNSGNEWGLIDMNGAVRLCSGTLYGTACSASIGPTDGSSIYSKGTTTFGSGSSNYARVNADGVAVGGSLDAGIARSAAGVLKATDGGTNTRDWLARHTLAGGTAPTITANCGTSPSIAGMDGAGRVTVGTGGIATSCTVTFNVAWATAPACTVSNESTILLTQATATATTLVLTAATPFVAADKLAYICVGY